MKMLTIHPQDPQARLVQDVVEVLENDGIVAYPTSSGYSLGCKLGNTGGVERIRKIRNLQPKHDFTLMCSSIAMASEYAKIDNSAFAMLKRLEPSKYTFILNATPELSRKVSSKRGTIGVRIAQLPVIKAILDQLGHPLLSVSLLVPCDEDYAKGKLVHQGATNGLELLSFDNADDVTFALRNLVEMVVDVGEIPNLPTTVLDVTDTSNVKLLRQGAGDEWNTV